MVFSSPVFLFLYLPVVYLVNLALPARARNFFLLVASLFFYAWGEPVYVLLMVFSTMANYMLALWLGGAQGSGKKRALAAIVTVNLLLLGVFKYAGFFVSNLDALTGLAIAVPQLRLPVGISFFTFHAISYAMDIYRGKTAPQKSLVNVALYISFFPQLIAGPIVRYHDVQAQLEARVMTVDKTAAGVRRFVVGLGKKLLIANAAGLLADRVFALPAAGLNMPLAWLGALAYAIQIYFDFSGYSDMALGLAKMFGFEFLENFNYPYIARGIKDFWRRWHISLTNWFREYLYFPLGGNRKGLKRTCLNMTVVFLCTGFWHGAAWTFVVWGCLHGLFLILETVGAIQPEKFRWRWLGHVYALAVVVVTFVVFRAETFPQALSIFGAMFAGFDFSADKMSVLLELLTPAAVVALAAGVVGCMPVSKGLRSKLSAWKGERFADAAGYLYSGALLVLCVLCLSASSYNPFIYFRF